MAKTIFATADDIDRHQSLTDALQLQDLCVVGQEYCELSHTLILLCVPRWFCGVCPTCGQVCSQVHDYPKQRTIHDTPIRGCHTRLAFDSHRLWCDRCRAPFTQPIRDVVPGCTYTYRLMNEIADPRRKQDVATLAEVYGLGYKLVEGIILRAAEAKIEQRRQEPVRVKRLGIDEIANHKGRSDYVLVLTDLEQRKLLDILPDRKKDTLITWLQTPSPGIDLSALEIVATDLWAHYREAVHTVYSHVAVVADRFHVMQNLNEAIHATRREMQRQATSDEERSKLKGLRYLLIKDKSKVKDSEWARLDDLKQSHPALYQLQNLRQQLHDWYETETTPELAKASLQSWLEEAAALGLHHLDKFCETLKNWQTEIVNFFAERVTSGFVEGMNSKIRLLKRLAFGLPNFEHFRLRMIWACG